MNASCHLVEVCVHYTKIPRINPECAERFNFSVICAKDPTCGGSFASETYLKEYIKELGSTAVSWLALQPQMLLCLFVFAQTADLSRESAPALNWMSVRGRIVWRWRREQTETRGNSGKKSSTDNSAMESKCCSLWPVSTSSSRLHFNLN